MVSAYETFSRGALRLTSADPAVEPEIDFQMLSDERDLVRLRDGLRRLVAADGASGGDGDRRGGQLAAARRFVDRRWPTTRRWTTGC